MGEREQERELSMEEQRRNEQAKEPQRDGPEAEKPEGREEPMLGLKRRLASIAELIPPGSQVVYIDYPLHENIGDLLIMQGTEAFFAERGIRVRRRYSVVNYRGPVRIPRDWIVVCHGGGNFGDLYPRYQRLRESVALHYPHNRIVVLPQTIEFRDEAAGRRSMEALGRHPDLHLFVRDRESLAKASEMIANVYLSPDMAHQLYPLRPSAGTDGAGGWRPGTETQRRAGRSAQGLPVDDGGSPANRLPAESASAEALPELALLRTDGELAGDPDAVPEATGPRTVTDWPRILSPLDLALLRLIVLASSLDRRLRGALPIWPVWRRLANRYVAKAIRLYARHGRVVTSRLHGHLLACLLNMPNVLLDNSYGKNARYYRDWTRGVEQAEAAMASEPEKRDHEAQDQEAQDYVAQEREAQDHGAQEHETKGEERDGRGLARADRGDLHAAST